MYYNLHKFILFATSITDFTSLATYTVDFISLSMSVISAASSNAQKISFGDFKHGLFSVPTSMRDFIPFDTLTTDFNFFATTAFQCKIHFSYDFPYRFNFM